MRLRAPRWRGSPGKGRARVVVSTVAAVTLGCAGLAAIAAAPTANAAAACTATYSVVNDWGSGFQIGLNITAGSSALTGWTVSFTFAGNQTLTQGWSGTWSQSGKTVTVTNASWNGSLAAGASTQNGALFNYSGTNTAPATVTCTGTGSTPPPTTAPPTTAPPTTAPPTTAPPTTAPPTTAPPTTAPPTTTPTGSCPSGGSLKLNPPTVTVPAGTSTDIGVSLSASPSSAVGVTVSASGGGLSITAGSSVTLNSSNWNLPQPITITAGSGSGTTTITASATGCTPVSITGTVSAATPTGTATHVVNPFSGATQYVNPDYTNEVKTQLGSTPTAQDLVVAGQSTFIWLDHIGAIYGGSDTAGPNNTDNGGTRLSLQSQLNNALAASSGPVTVPIVIYDLPDRDCSALASNGELSIANNGLNYYEHSYIDPIVQILSGYKDTNLRITAVIENDSLPNLVTNTSVAACGQAQSSGVYVSGIQYAMSQLHALGNVYNYMDIAHSAWLGWSSNMSPAVSLLHQVAAGTTAGVASVDGFISNAANTIPYHEPFMTATQQVDGNPVDSVQYYSFDPFIDEATYDQAMYNALVGAGFSSNVGIILDSGRDGWGGPNRPTAAATSFSSTADFVNKSKVDQRPFRGDWCNPEGMGIGNLPQANPDSSFSHLYADVWEKPPGESDGTYPAFAGAGIGDPHCDPNGTQTDGSGNSYPTDAFPDSPPAGNFFPAEFNQLVANADPAIP